MSEDSFFSTVKSLMGHIMAILEKKYGMDIPEADSGVAHKELWDRMENCRKQQGTGQVISALEILLNYTCLLSAVSIVTDRSGNRILLEPDKGRKYQIRVTETDEDI